MALSSHEIVVGKLVRAAFETKTPVAPATPEVTLSPGQPVLLGKPRDNVGAPDFTALTARASLTTDSLPVEELHDFATYQEAGGVFSKGLYEAAMEGVKLQKPDVGKSNYFFTGIEWQIRGFEDRHGRTLPPPKQKFELTEVQKDAYRLLRGSLFIPDEDRQKKAYLDDASLFKEILIMPGLKPNKLSEQEKLAGTDQPQVLATAA